MDKLTSLGLSHNSINLGLIYISLWGGNKIKLNVGSSRATQGEVESRDSVTQDLTSLKSRESSHTADERVKKKSKSQFTLSRTWATAFTRQLASSLHMIFFHTNILSVFP